MSDQSTTLLKQLQELAKGYPNQAAIAKAVSDELGSNISQPTISRLIAGTGSTKTLSVVVYALNNIQQKHGD